MKQIKFSEAESNFLRCAELSGPCPCEGGQVSELLGLLSVAAVVVALSCSP